MLLSVLIPTLESRKKSLVRILGQLSTQMVQHGLQRDVEVLQLCDRGKETIGRKRNQLLEQARGDFVAFVDDDDAVSDDYLPLICGALRRHPGIDCIGIKGIITFRGRHPRTFIHSLDYRTYFTRGETFYRPPYHLNPMRRTIAARYRFAEVNCSEDVDWALRICRDRALHSEYFIDSVIYHYHSRRSWSYQWLLDRTETVRHALGLCRVNLVRFQRGARAAHTWGRLRLNDPKGKR